MNRITNSPTLKPAAKFGARLSPRRKHYLQKFLGWLQFNGGKRLLDDRAYGMIREDISLDKFGVNQAVDDGYALGLLDGSMVGMVQSVTVLSSNLEDAS